MATMALPDQPVDIGHGPSVRYARPAPDPNVPAVDRRPIPVGPGRRSLQPSPASGAHRDDVSGYPVQYAKVQPPPLREETLARHRLLDWLAQKINQRVVLVLADAGYGKTTLLADFANRTRLRTLWYRMDEDDRDWISLLSHLVAAGREADASFAPHTAALLADTSLSGPTRDAAVDVFIRELPSIAPQGSVLIFDDFHLVDDAPDAQLIVRAIVANAPERLSVVFSSRRSPGIPMAKLRATGEVATLTTDDLRFDAEETESLFRDTYHRSLEPEILADVAARTEGWAASLQLVNAALRDRSPGEIRGFVRSLTGADQVLYDYLAEEVVGDLPVELQGFLMRTSILQVVTPEFAEVAAGIDSASVARLTANAERLTLLARRARGPRNELRYHPLVREFLESRLTREVGEPGVRNLHRLVATYAEARDWRIAAHHLWLCGDRARALDVIDEAMQSIIGRGEYLIAAPFVADLEEGATRSSFQVVLSRRDFKQGDVRDALARATRAVDADPTSGVALANLASLTLTLGDVEASGQAASRLLAITADPGWIRIAKEILMLIDTSVGEDIQVAIDRLVRMASEQRLAGQSHFEGISYLNLAEAFRATDQPTESIEMARLAIERLEASSTAAEIASAHALAAWSLIHTGQTVGGWSELDLAMSEDHESIRIDVLAEASYLEALYGNQARALDYLAEVERSRERFPL
jgi:tetratricopeptide (TPR) repeat protein